MRILLIHNYYQQAGGEDRVFEAEKNLLSNNGHEVKAITWANEKIKMYSGLDKFLLPAKTIWNQESFSRTKRFLKEFRPDVVHVHNFFPLASPSIYYAINEEDIPVIQTLHNYRLLCPAATFLRNGQVCQVCYRKSTVSAIPKACYHSSVLATAAVSGMLEFHRWVGTWRTKVDFYVALTEFMRDIFVGVGFGNSNVLVKPNFVSDLRLNLAKRIYNPSIHIEEKYAVFIGRLSAEKGANVAIRAWTKLGRTFPLKLVIVGDGPERSKLQILAGNDDNIFFAGSKPHAEAMQFLSHSFFLVVPSIGFEAFPLTVIEAFSLGKPVVASGIGSLRSIVRDDFDEGENGTGLRFRPNDADDLAAKVEWAWKHRNEMEELGRQARLEYEANYTPEKNYQMLMNIYQTAITLRKGGVRPE